MKHLDLFSGIGGFALAADRVWPGIEHTFCEIDPFCQEVLKKHWPKSKIYNDIRTLTSNPEHDGSPRTQETGTDSSPQPKGEARQKLSINESSGDNGLRKEESGWDLLTGGFPCQPFSQAGRRKGTEDDRHLWPEMLRVIREFAPLWVIGENVGGFVTWNEGLVLRQVFFDLEGEGYEVQAFIIPAVSVNAPHRRDRVWIVANRNTNSNGRPRRNKKINTTKAGKQTQHNLKGRYTNDSNAKSINEKRRDSGQGKAQFRRSDWSKNWIEVATELCRVDDGIPRRMDRNPRLKALGNAIVPQVAEEIMRAIKELS